MDFVPVRDVGHRSVQSCRIYHHGVRLKPPEDPGEELRFGWLEWARNCALEMWAVRARFDVSAREPITESEYRKREEEARKELIPHAEPSDVFAGRQ